MSIEEAPAIKIGDRLTCVEEGLITITQIHPDGSVEATDDLGFFVIYSADVAAARITDGRWSRPAPADILHRGFEISE